MESELRRPEQPPSVAGDAGSLHDECGCVLSDPVRIGGYCDGGFAVMFRDADWKRHSAVRVFQPTLRSSLEPV